MIKCDVTKISEPTAEREQIIRVGPPGRNASVLTITYTKQLWTMVAKRYTDTLKPKMLDGETSIKYSIFILVS